ncbi:MAG: enoyl-CoA hydratase-related protein [Ramlibacter sp.]|nr:enoyl-CoA hydratase-related protein [Ramlibacter sp.]
MKDTYETLLVEQQDEHVLLVTMNRPDVLNALNTQLGLDLVDLFESVAMNPEKLRCIVLTGTGSKGFCAGGDLKQRDGMSNADWTLQHVVFERMARALLDCPVPLVAAVNGAAFGGGCEIAMCCDFMYAADHAKFAMPEVKLGIMPGAGGTQTLPRAVGERRAKEYVMTGKAFSAAQAEQWGLVNEVMPLESLVPRALEVARLIAANAPLSTRQVKQSVSRGLRMSLGDGLAFEIEAYNRLVATEDRIEGVRAFNEKRKAQFKGR